MNLRASLFGVAATTTALTVFSVGSRAQFCPVCGTNPCREVARARGLRITAPPGPKLDPRDNVALAGWGSRLLRAGSDTAGRIADSAQLRLMSAKPVSLINTIDQLAESVAELRQPTTIESWGRAIQMDAVLGIIKEVYTGTAATAPNAGIKAAASIYSAAGSAQGGTPSRSRLEQYFGILDQTISQITGQAPAPAQKQPGASLRLASYPASADASLPQDEARQLREKMWVAVMAGLTESGMYDQALDFHGIAEKRWGKPRLEPMGSTIQRELEKIHIWHQQSDFSLLATDEGVEGARESATSTLEYPGTLDVSFRSAQPAGQAKPWILQASFAPDDNHRPQGFQFGVQITHSRDGALSFEVGGYAFPTTVSSAGSSGWNTLKLAFRPKFGEATKNLAGTIHFYLNGQLAATTDVYQRIQDKPHRVRTPSALPVKVTVVGGSGVRAEVRLWKR